MQIKMLEYVQGKDIRGRLPNGSLTDLLEPGKTYEVDEQLGAWLLDNRKAEKVEAETEVIEVSEPLPVIEETEPQPDKPRRRSKKSEG